MQVSWQLRSVRAPLLDRATGEYHSQVALEKASSCLATLRLANRPAPREAETLEVRMGQL